MRKFFFLLLLLTVFLPSYSIDTHWDLEPQIIKNGVGNNTIYHICYGSKGGSLPTRESPATMASDFVIIRSL